VPEQAAPWDVPAAKALLEAAAQEWSETFDAMEDSVLLVSGDGRGVHVVTDITQLRQAERAARERSHFLEELLEAVPVPLFYKDTSLRYAGVNQAFAAWVGRPKDEIIGKTIFDVRPGEVAGKLDLADRDFLARQGGPVMEEHVLPGRDGKPRHILNHKAPGFSFSQ
jgi:PAS domain S-box-containing protein